MKSSRDLHSELLTAHAALVREFRKLETQPFNAEVHRAYLQHLAMHLDALLDCLACLRRP
jgi:hypothetical protein